MNDERIAEVRRLRLSGAGRIKDKVLVIFCGIESRDTVTSYAKSLAEQVSSDGTPLAGLRMEIPSHLMGLIRLLEGHGRNLKKKYGAEFKRHIRFYDTERSLYLNVRLPGDDAWTRIGPLGRSGLSTWKYQFSYDH